MEYLDEKVEIQSQRCNFNTYGELISKSNNSFSYSLDRDTKGIITKKTETLNTQERTLNYKYDNRGRLTTVTKDNQEVESYTYDDNGNRVSATVNGVTTNAYYTLDDNIENYAGVTYTYDEDGQLTQKGNTHYKYNTYGALTEVTLEDGTNIKYHLNPLNQRVAKEVNRVITEKYLWRDLTTLLAIYDKDDNLIQRFNYANDRMPISMTQDNQTYYFHYDQVGTLKAVTDQNNNIIKEITYDTFGNILSRTNINLNIPFGFAGGLHDRDTNLVHFGYREYDPQTGKWTAKDPIDFSGGDSNLYGYVLGDPVGFVDPEGLNPLIGVGIVAGGGGIIAAITTPSGGNYKKNIIAGVILGSGAGVAIALSTIPGFVVGAIADAGNVYNSCK